MVRPANVARSRACQQCKRKRIKCDLHDPCHRCIESNLVCSGPISGLLMVNASAGPSRQPRPIAPLQNRALQRTQPLQYELPASLSPPISAVDDALLWKFLHYFSQDTGGRSWTAKLPSLITAKNARAMKAAARAVSLAYAAQSMNNPQMAREAREYYGNSLRFHQFSFRAPPGKSPCKPKAINALPVTVLLSYFEMMQATSPEAWLNHTLAAERLFALVGPDALKDDLLNHLYFIIRANSATRCFLLGSRTQLHEQQWADIMIMRPCGDGTNVFHNLLNIIISLCNSMHASSEAKSPASVARDITAFEVNLDELIALWAQFGEAWAFDTNQYPLIQGIDMLNEANQTSTDQTGPLELPIALQNVGAALSAAFFHAATIILLTLLYKRHLLIPHESAQAITPLCRYTDLVQGGNNQTAIGYHCNQILLFSEVLRTSQIGCTCARMVLPLAVVHRMSSSSQQRLMAEDVFRKWCSSDGLPGLALLAFGEDRTLDADPTQAQAVPTQS